MLDACVKYEYGSWNAAHVLDALRYFWSLTISFCIFKILFLQSVLAGSASLAPSFFILSMLFGWSESSSASRRASVIDEENWRARLLLEGSQRPAAWFRQTGPIGRRRRCRGRGIGLLHPSQFLLKIDDVDAVAFSEEELLHLWVPPIRLVPEMDTRF